MRWGVDGRRYIDEDPILATIARCHFLAVSLATFTTTRSECPAVYSGNELTHKWVALATSPSTAFRAERDLEVLPVALTTASMFTG